MSKPIEMAIRSKLAVEIWKHAQKVVKAEKSKDSGKKDDKTR